MYPKKIKFDKCIFCFFFGKAVAKQMGNSINFKSVLNNATYANSARSFFKNSFLNSTIRQFLISGMGRMGSNINKSWIIGTNLLYNVYNVLNATAARRGNNLETENGIEFLLKCSMTFIGTDCTKYFVKSRVLFV